MKAVKAEYVHIIKKKIKLFKFNKQQQKAECLFLKEKRLKI